jgi:hypothetical protein
MKKEIHRYSILNELASNPYDESATNIKKSCTDSAKEEEARLLEINGATRNKLK